MPLSALIIENEKQAQILLRTIIQDYCPDLECLGIASNPKEAEELILKTNPDILFLDIELDEGTGFDLLLKFPVRNFKVVFTTAYDQFAVKAIKEEAIDYILKPYGPKDVISAVHKIKKRKSSADGNMEDFIQSLQNKVKVSFKTSEGIYILNTDKISHVNGEGAYCTIVDENCNSILVSKNIGDVEKLLPQKSFFRIHKSYLVNLNHIKKLENEDGGYILTSCEQRIPIARRKKQAFLDLLSKSE